MAHAIVRTDMMAGTINPAFLENGRYVVSEAYADIDNGSICMVGALEEGERESHVYSDVPAGTALDKLVVIAAPELMNDLQDHSHVTLRDFYVKAGTCVRGYYLAPRGEFSVSVDGITGSPSVGASVGLDADTHKLKVGATDTVIGKIIDIEVKKSVTFYVIKIGA